MNGINFALKKTYTPFFFKGPLEFLNCCLSFLAKEVEFWWSCDSLLMFVIKHTQTLSQTVLNEWKSRPSIGLCQAKFNLNKTLLKHKALFLCSFVFMKLYPKKVFLCTYIVYVVCMRWRWSEFERNYLKFDKLKIWNPSSTFIYLCMLQQYHHSPLFKENCQPTNLPQSIKTFWHTLPFNDNNW